MKPSRRHAGALVAVALVIAFAVPMAPAKAVSYSAPSIATLVQSTSTASTSTSPSTSATTSITVNNGTTTVYNASSGFKPFTPPRPAGGQGSTAYLILAAVAVIVVLFGVVMWRRKVASDNRDQPK